MTKVSKVSLGFFLMMALMAPMAQAETILGYFEGILGGDNAATGAVGMTGWAVADSGIAKVVIQVDGVDIGQAFYGGLRPDVTAAQPGYVDSPAPGFGYFLNTTDFWNGNHTVSVKVHTFAGNIVVIPGTRIIFFGNSTAVLKPFGYLEWPHRNADLTGTCGAPLATNRILTPVVGYALDLGVEIGDTGIGYVELLLDGSIIYNTDLDCHYSIFEGGFSQCYGMPRVDVENIFPFALNAPSAGFRFVLDVGAFIDFGWAQGNHVLTIRAGDISTQVANIAEIPVNFFCDTNLPTAYSFGFIESPLEDRPYEDTVVFQGWALDAQGVQFVEVYVDGLFAGRASYGVDSRPSVALQYPGYPDSFAPVWRFNYDTTQTSDGFHQVQFWIIDDTGVGSFIGERTFFVDNEHP